MADVADMAVEIEAEHLARGLSRIRPVAVGVAGECDECGEDMPRLVDGRCGYCRDGRAQPVERLGATVAPSIKKDRIVAKPPAADAARQISFMAKGATLRAIEGIAGEDGVSLAQATLGLVEAALADPPEASPPGVDLAGVHLDALLEEVKLRVDRAAPPEALAVANARAETAERKLAQLKELMA